MNNFILTNEIANYFNKFVDLFRYKRIKNLYYMLGYS